MNILRKIVSLVVLVAAVVVLVAVCMTYHWEYFQLVFKNFSFKEFGTSFKAFAAVLADFFDVAGNAIVLTMLGFIGLTMPGRKK